MPPAEQQSRTSHTTLPQACQPGFALIMGLLTGSEFGEPTQLRTRIGDMFTEMERRTRLAGISSEDILSARFALTAFIDEAINRSDWRSKTVWAQNPLSLEYFNTNNAGVEFFANLDALRQRPDAKTDLLEVYYTCLALGFEGKYALTDPRQLQNLIETTARELERIRGRISGLSPHWEPPEETLKRMRNELPLWVVAGISSGLVFVVYLVFRFMASGHAEGIASRLRTMM
jgi:type VI secretion system protein ImpK